MNKKKLSAVVLISAATMASAVAANADCSGYWIGTGLCRADTVTKNAVKPTQVKRAARKTQLKK